MSPRRYCDPTGIDDLFEPGGSRGGWSLARSVQAAVGTCRDDIKRHRLPERRWAMANPNDRSLAEHYRKNPIDHDWRPDRRVLCTYGYFYWGWALTCNKYLRELAGVRPFRAGGNPWVDFGALANWLLAPVRGPRGVSIVRGVAATPPRPAFLPSEASPRRRRDRRFYRPRRRRDARATPRRHALRARRRGESRCPLAQTHGVIKRIDRIMQKKTCDLGIHLRRADRGLQGGRSPNSKWVSMVEDWLNSSKREPRVFVAADSESRLTKKAIATLLKHRGAGLVGVTGNTADRESSGGVFEALAENYVLSACDELWPHGTGAERHSEILD